VPRVKSEVILKERVQSFSFLMPLLYFSLSTKKVTVSGSLVWPKKGGTRPLPEGRTQDLSLPLLSLVAALSLPCPLLALFPGLFFIL